MVADGKWQHKRLSNGPQSPSQRYQIGRFNSNSCPSLTRHLRLEQVECFSPFLPPQKTGWLYFQRMSWDLSSKLSPMQNNLLWETECLHSSVCAESLAPCIDALWNLWGNHEREIWKKYHSPMHTDRIACWQICQILYGLGSDPGSTISCQKTVAFSWFLCLRKHVFAILENVGFVSPPLKPIKFQQTPDCLKSSKGAPCKTLLCCQPLTEQWNPAAHV